VGVCVSEEVCVCECLGFGGYPVDSHARPGVEDEVDPDQLVVNQELSLGIRV